MVPGETHDQPRGHRSAGRRGKEVIDKGIHTGLTVHAPVEVGLFQAKADDL